MDLVSYESLEADECAKTEKFGIHIKYLIKNKKQPEIGFKRFSFELKYNQTWSSLKSVTFPFLRHFSRRRAFVLKFRFFILVLETLPFPSGFVATNFQRW